MDGKYGGLYTTDDVVRFAHFIGAELAGVDRGMSEDQVAAHLEEWSKKEGNTRFPLDEPLFLFRARDDIAPASIIDYYARCKSAGCPTNHLVGIDTALERFEEWQNTNTTKLPD